MEAVYCRNHLEFGMNLAFVIYRYFPHGGLQQDLEKIVCEAISRGHKVTIFAGEWQGPRIPFANLEILRPAGLTKSEKIASFELKAFRRFARKKFDAVIGFSLMRGLDVYFAGNDAFPVELPKPGFWHHLLSPHYRIELKQEREVFAPHAKTKILYLTESQKREFIRIYHTPEERFHLLPPGISEDRRRPEDRRKLEKIREEIRKEFRLEQDSLLLLQVACNFTDQGVDRTLQAFAALPDTLASQCHLLIAGSDTSGARLEKLAGSLKISGRTTFAGWRDDIGNLMFSSDLLLCPARARSAGSVLVEAIAAGLPAICTERCGYSTFTAESGGVVLTEPFAQNDLNHMLEELVLSPDLIAEMKSATISYAAGFNLYHRQRKAVDFIEENFPCAR